MHLPNQRLQAIFSFSVKSDICICERTVFVGERHFIFFNAGSILAITSLKNEKPFWLCLQLLLCLTGIFFDR
jgi:hypothetical protein